MLAGNMKWARSDFSWSSVEGTQGVYNWATPDAVVAYQQGLGLSILAIIENPPTWALTAGVLNATGQTRLALFTVALVARYAPQGVKAYEFFNEVNISSNWQKFNYDTTLYATLLQASYQAAKAVDPTIQFLHSGLANQQTNDATHQKSTDFLTTVYTTIGAGYFDAFNYHAYGTGGYFTTASLNELKSLYALMVTNGDSVKKVWVTEFGYPTNGTGGQAFTDEGSQALMLQSAIRGMRTLPYIGPIIFYDFVDDVGSQPDREGYFGMLRSDGTHKPSYITVRDTIAGG